MLHAGECERGEGAEVGSEILQDECGTENGNKSARVTHTRIHFTFLFISPTPPFAGPFQIPRENGSLFQFHRRDQTRN